MIRITETTFPHTHGQEGYEYYKDLSIDDQTIGHQDKELRTLIASLNRLANNILPDTTQTLVHGDKNFGRDPHRQI